MMSTNRIIRDVEHLEKKSQILNVVRIVIIMNVEPIHGMSGGIFIPYTPTIHPRWDENRRCKTPRTFRWNKSKVIVPLHILLLHLIQIFNTGQSELLKVLLDLWRCEVGDVSGFSFSLRIGWDEVIRFDGSYDFG